MRTHSTGSNIRWYWILHGNQRIINTGIYWAQTYSIRSSASIAYIPKHTTQQIARIPPGLSSDVLDDATLCKTYDTVHCIAPRLSQRNVYHLHLLVQAAWTKHNMHCEAGRDEGKTKHRNNYPSSLWMKPMKEMYDGTNMGIIHNSRK